MAQEVSVEEARALFGVEEVGDLAKYYANRVANLKLRHAQETQELKATVEQLQQQCQSLEDALQQMVDNQEVRDDPQTPESRDES